MTIYKGYPSETETLITRIDVLEIGGTFRTGEDEHDIALILETEHGVQFGIEYISSVEFGYYMAQFLSLPPADIFEFLGQKSEDFNEPSIDFSIVDAEMIQHFEQFRISQDNKSKLVNPFTPPYQN